MHNLILLVLDAAATKLVRFKVYSVRLRGMLSLSLEQIYAQQHGYDDTAVGVRVFLFCSFAL